MCFNFRYLVSTGTDSDRVDTLHSTKRAPRDLRHLSASVPDPVAIAPGTDLLDQLGGSL